MKFLVVRFSSIGDIVFTTPVVRCLKKQVPGAEVHFLIKPQFRSIMEPNPYVDKIHVLQKDWKAMVAALKEEKFDYLIDLHKNVRTLRLKLSLDVPSFSFQKLNFEKLVFTKLKWNLMPHLHIVDRNLKTVERFGVHDDGEGMDYFIPESERVPLRDIPFSHHAGFVAIVIGASYPTKKLPVYKLQELCGKLHHPIILLGGKEDAAEGEAIASIDPIKIYNACGKFSLHESADLVRQSRVVVGHDTGLTHIGAALKKPVIAVWGSTTKEFGIWPYYGKNFLQGPIMGANVQVEKLWCRPCTKFGRNKCPQGHFKCMKKMDTDEIVRLVNLRLGRN